MKKHKEAKLSESIELILKIFEKCKSDAQTHEANLKTAENEENDIKWHTLTK